jgi:hypothetical protein
MFWAKFGTTVNQQFELAMVSIIISSDLARIYVRMKIYILA